MCGIAGVFAYREGAPPVDVPELLRMRETMLARGPDGAGLWVSDDQRVALAHRRLAIIELSEAGAQPMHDPETGNWIVFNGEIYNHAALRAELQAGGAVVRTHSDTEVLLKLYARDGMGMLNRLRGMFAFAMWDARQRKLFLARDAFGIKPLYYADDGGSVRFASQVKTLLAGKVNTRPEPAGHAGFMLWGSVPEPWTLYKGIRALPAGHWMCIDGKRAAVPVCFDSPLLGLRDVRRAGAEALDETLARIAAAVKDSVAAHMVADVPVGVFLSAGLDSTMLAASAAAHGELRTVTLGFDEYRDTPYDEAPLAGLVAETLGAQHTLCRISSREFAEDREKLFAAMDQPSIDGVNVWFVSKAAAAQGLKVVLSGLGGDELFGSYPSFRQVPQLRRRIGWAQPLTAPLGRVLRKVLVPHAARLPSPKYAGLLEYGGSLAGAYLLRRALFMPWEIASVLGPEMAAEGLAELDTMTRLSASAEGLGSDRLRVSAFEMQWYMRNQLLRDADWAGMAHSLELRVPFVNMNLLRAFTEIPGLDSRVEKAQIARAVAPNLPESILTRPKTGFSIPVHQWLNPDMDWSTTNYRAWARTLYRSFVPV
ncbi:MAG: asparagine synthase (glutamine-hydrolyzing) [Rhodocyclaceae bacterium]